MDKRGSAKFALFWVKGAFAHLIILGFLGFIMLINSFWRAFLVYAFAIAALLTGYVANQLRQGQDLQRSD
jgi:hypothetical protein